MLPRARRGGGDSSLHKLSLGCSGCCHRRHGYSSELLFTAISKLVAGAGHVEFGPMALGRKPWGS